MQNKAKHNTTETKTDLHTHLNDHTYTHTRQFPTSEEKKRVIETKQQQNSKNILNVYVYGKCFAIEYF